MEYYESKGYFEGEYGDYVKASTRWNMYRNKPT